MNIKLLMRYFTFLLSYWVWCVFSPSAQARADQAQARCSGPQAAVAPARAAPPCRESSRHCRAELLYTFSSDACSGDK